MADTADTKAAPAEAAAAPAAAAAAPAAAEEKKHEFHDRTDQLIARARQKAAAASVAHLLPGLHTFAASAGSDDLSANLDDLLNKAGSTGGGSTTVAVVPSSAIAAPSASNNSNPSDFVQLLHNIQYLDSYIHVVAAMVMYQKHPAPYDITTKSGAAKFTQDFANAMNYVLTGGAIKAVAAYLPVGSIVAQSFSKQVDSASLHLEFLNGLFGSFGFDSSTTKQLDGILTNVFQNMSNMSFEMESQSATVDHMICVYHFDKIQGTGGKDEPPAMWTAKMRLFFLHINQETWKTTIKIGKSSGEVRHYNFQMNYIDMDTTMSAAVVQDNLDQIKTSVKTLTSKEADEVKKLMEMKAVTEPNK